MQTQTSLTLLGLDGFAMANARLAIKDAEGRVAPRCWRRRALAPPLVDDQAREATPTLLTASLS